MMHDRRPSKPTTGAIPGLKSHFLVLGGRIPMKTPIGTEIPIGGSYPEIQQAEFRVALGSETLKSNLAEKQNPSAVIYPLAL